VAMPVYWIGFALGFIEIKRPEVRAFILEIFSKWHFIAIVVVLEIIGASFYFFEFFGLSRIDATLVALITGAHILFVWLFDLYIKSRYKNAVSLGSEHTKILLFTIPTENLEAYEISSRVIILQGICIVLTLFGLSLWP
jgi:hypothetical protein